MSEAPLEALLAAHAAGLEDASLREVAGGREVVAADVAVAVLAADAVELRLRPSVAAAALRTPDVTPSARGAGWVRFTPAALDDFARDRAVAWLESAVRLAAEDDGAS